MTTATATTTARPLGTAEVAKLLRCTRKTLLGYVRRGTVPPPLRLSSRRWVWSPGVISEWLAKGGRDDRSRER
jgi:predicted DNA-binding transcriptional regulator AlpA